MNNNRNISTFSPFITFCQHVIPLAYDESMSYYETLCALRDYLLNTVIPAVNNNADAVTELQNKYNDFTNNINETVQNLENYIDNYFKNLDVQTEINNKLDQMAKDGQLQNIIAQYLEIASILAFNTRADLKSANNLNNGSFTYCYGKDTYNDGYGAFYKIRESINTDVPDEENLIPLTNYSNLVAEKMPDKYLSDSITTVTNDLNNLTQTVTDNYNTLNNKIENFEKQKITVVLGDSWTVEGSAPARDNAESWVETFKKYTKNKVINKAVGGSGFAREGYDTFSEQFQHVVDDETIDKNLIDTIIIYGGLNDVDNCEINDIITGGNNLGTLIQNNCIYAKVYCAFFNLPKRANTQKAISFTSQFINAMSKYNWNFNRAAGWVKGNNAELYATDGYHPNAKGCERIAECMWAFINGTEGPSIPIEVQAPKINNDRSYPGSTTNNLKYFPLTGTVDGEVIYRFSQDNVITEPSDNRYISWYTQTNIDALTDGFLPCNSAIAQKENNFDVLSQSTCAPNSTDSMWIIQNATVVLNNNVTWKALSYKIHYNIT